MRGKRVFRIIEFIVQAPLSINLLVYLLVRTLNVANHLFFSLFYSWDQQKTLQFYPRAANPNLNSLNYSILFPITQDLFINDKHKVWWIQKVSFKSRDKCKPSLSNSFSQNIIWRQSHMTENFVIKRAIFHKNTENIKYIANLILIFYYKFILHFSFNDFQFS